jgi:hypothetical protein
MELTFQQIRNPIVQSIGLLVAIFFVYGYLQSDPVNPSIMYGIFHTINLVFHEAGHTLCMVFGHFLYILGGSLFQVLIPSLIAYYFYVQQDLFSMSVILSWVSANVWEVAVYMKDAKDRVLPLLGDDPDSHDWYNLFSDMGILHKAVNIGQAFHSLAYVVLLCSVSIGLYSIWMPYSEFLIEKTKSK